MSRRKKKKLKKGGPRVGPLGTKAEQFAEALEANEANMGEMAAFAVTCEQFMIDEEEGYDLLAELAQDADWHRPRG